GAPRLHSRQVRAPGRRAVLGPERATHRYGGEVRGWSQRADRGRRQHTRRRYLSVRILAQERVTMSEAPAQRRIADVLLKLDGISLAFGGVKALDDVSFEVRSREIRAIIGPNGAGKSSLLNVINGVYHPSEGTVTYKGTTHHQMRPHEAA